MSSPCAWFPAHTFEPRRYRPGNIGNWSGHLPFAHDLVAAFRPSCFVELGTHLGESYFGFCQSIAENQVPCVAYAVDTWVGEEHTGFYDNSVYEEVLAYNQATYASFSYLLRSLFDDALKNFGDESIDLLHIDGLHLFEAVSHDFDSWLPKVRPGGIVLLHDVCVKERDFGVWKLWERLNAEGDTFEFHHSWGLGVFRKPGGGALESELLKALFEGGAELHEQVRRYYSLAAMELESKHRDNSLLQRGLAEDHPRLQIYLPANGGYEEERSQIATVKPNEWQCITLDIPEGVSSGAIRLDVADRPTIVDIRGITLLSAVDQTPVWSSSGLDLSELEVGGTLMPIKSSDENGSLRFFSYGNDPQVYLPSLEARRLDQPLTLKIWLRVQIDLGALAPIITEPPDPLPLSPIEPELLESLQSRVDALTQELDQERLANASVRTELAASRREHEMAVAEINKAAEKAAEEINKKQALLMDELNQKQTKLYLLEDLRHELKQENDELRDRFVRLEKTYLDLKNTFATVEAAHSEIQTSHQELLKKHQATEGTLANVLRSRSWRLTAPLRSVTETLKDRSGSGGNSN